MPNPVEGLLEVCEGMVEVLPVLEIFFTEDSYEMIILRGFDLYDKWRELRKKRFKPEGSENTRKWTTTSRGA